MAAALRFTHLLAHAFNLLVDISKEAFKLVLNLICTQHDTETRTHNKGRGRGRGKGRGKERVSRSKQTNKHTKRSSLHPGSLHTCTRRCQGWTFQSLSSQLPWRKEGSTCLPCPGTIKKQEEDKSKTKTHQQASKQHTHTHTHTHTRKEEGENKGQMFPRSNVNEQRLSVMLSPCRARAQWGESALPAQATQPPQPQQPPQPTALRASSSLFSSFVFCFLFALFVLKIGNHTNKRQRSRGREREREVCVCVCVRSRWRERVCVCVCDTLTLCHIIGTAC